MEYDKPIFGDFIARSLLEPVEDWTKFSSALAKRGKARVMVVSTLEHEGQVVGRFSGQFVALGTHSARKKPD